MHDHTTFAQLPKKQDTGRKASILTNVFKQLFTVGNFADNWIMPGLILWLLAGYPANGQTLSTDSQMRVRQAVDNVRVRLEKDLQIKVPSLSVLIQTSAGKTFVSSGSKPITETTYFRFASNTKNFTATAILNMNEDGWLNYKAHITDLIPGTKVPYVPNTPDWNFPNKSLITIEQLLQHSAGVYDVDNSPVPGFDGMSFTEYVMEHDLNHQFNTDEMVQQLTRHKLSFFAPGKDYHYSNTGYAMLGEIIKRVYSTKSGSPKTYQDYLETVITGPKTPVPVPIRFPVKASDNTMPKPYVEGVVINPKNTETFTKYNMSGQVAEGNGYGTMASLNTHIRSLMTGKSVLKPQTVKLMQTDVSSAKKTYGLGCSHIENVGYGHNGARIGYLSQMAYDPANDVSVVVLLPIWDLRKGNESLGKCMEAMNNAAIAARTALGYKK